MLNIQRKFFSVVIVFVYLILLGFQAQAEGDMFPNKVTTHIGDLTFDHGVPTKETSNKLYYEMDYHRAVQVYLWSLPIVGQAQWRQSYLDQYNIQPNQSVFATRFNERSLVLTANESTPYIIGWTNVKEKAAVIQVPEGPFIGLLIDFWQRGLADLGVFGSNAGKGGTWVLTGPDTPKDKIPYIEGAGYVHSQTNNLWWLIRLNAKPEDRDELARSIKFGYFDEEPRSQLIPGDNKPGRNYQPRGMKYWQMLHDIIQEEPVEERDRFFMYFLKEMGIEKDKPFQPTERQKKIMADAVTVGEAMAQNMVFRERLPGVLRDDGWRLILGTVPGKEPGDAMEHTQRAEHYDRFDPRARFTYEACTTSEKMSFPKPARGMGYAGVFLDTQGRALSGDRNYVIEVPADPPVDLFWAITTYDVDTRGLVTTDQERAERGSAHTGIKTNSDGSTPIFVGPKAPAGWEDNWIKSAPGRAWFPYFRFYGPTQPFFDQSWKLPQIEETDFSEYNK
ncbi:MAG: DUF1254 domain-containing protein [Desulfobacterales bacterium]|nr:DUF1254 domain-containing protein [Desulfobacterales bacterium]